MRDNLDERRRFAGLLTALSDYYKSEISKAVAVLYWEGLRQYDYEAIEKACWSHTQSPDENGRWFPKISDLTKVLHGSTQDQSAVAWSKVDTAIRTRGTWDDVVFDDPIIHRVIADMGGWVYIGTKQDDEWPFVAKDFQARYRSIKMRGEAAPEYQPKLTGSANAYNSSNGRPLLPPILLGDYEAAKRVLKGSGVAVIGMNPTNGENNEH